MVSAPAGGQHWRRRRDVWWPQVWWTPKGRPSYKGALHQSRNERDGHWVLGRTLPDLKLSLLLKRHNCIELSYLDPRIVRQVRPLPGVSRTCAVMINSLENPVHMNLLEELRKRPVRLRLKRARPAAKLPPPLLECRSGQPFEELWSDR